MTWENGSYDIRLFCQQERHDVRTICMSVLLPQNHLPFFHRPPPPPCEQEVPRTGELLYKERRRSVWTTSVLCVQCFVPSWNSRSLPLLLQHFRWPIKNCSKSANNWSRWVAVGVPWITDSGEYFIRLAPVCFNPILCLWRQKKINDFLN